MERNCYKKITLEMLTTMKLEMTYIHYQILASSSFDCFFKDKFILKSQDFDSILSGARKQIFFVYLYSSHATNINQVWFHSRTLWSQPSNVLLTWYFCLNSCKCVCWLSNQSFVYSSLISSQGWLPLILYHKLKFNLFQNTTTCSKIVIPPLSYSLIIPFISIFCLFPA